ncbi:hypothetical protein [Tahibacter amnicola]|uniref:Imelysin n=1 Tax=Tahibacter amnicola TaxID=2976241 RepID=A0ABY6BF83_9GAMM|nr:hypothetical protein [Tahibacter amnicola]UXI68475.1 hypothetical protein N4264_02140 [Tahibacter amnicola]
MLRRTLIALALSSVFAVAGAEETKVAAGTTSEPVVPSPADDAAAKAEEARFKAQYAQWRATATKEGMARYQSLRESAAPRDWAAASQMALERYWDDESAADKPALPTAAERAELLRNAAAAAPDDTLIQWMALTHMPNTSGGCAAPTPDPDATAAVMRLEPDNALAWLPSLKLAASVSDAQGVDTILARMAAAPRVDDHTVDFVNLSLDLEKRFPTSPTNMPVMPGVDQADLDFYGALGSASMMQPSLYPLTQACGRTEAKNADPRRFAACADIARTFALKGNRFELQRAGFRLLKQLGETDPELALRERQAQWLTHIVSADLGDDGGARFRQLLHEFHVAWRANPNEFEAMQAAATKLGLMSPMPPNWMPESHPDDEPETPSETPDVGETSAETTDAPPQS